MLFCLVCFLFLMVYCCFECTYLVLLLLIVLRISLFLICGSVFVSVIVFMLLNSLCINIVFWRYLLVLLVGFCNSCCFLAIVLGFLF